MKPYEGWQAIPVIFETSFRDPGGYFLATNVNMRHEDVIFVAESQSVEVTKFLNYMNTWITTTDNAVVTGVNGVTLRNMLYRIK